MDTLQANTQPGNIIKKYYCAFILAFLFFVSTYTDTHVYLYAAIGIVITMLSGWVISVITKGNKKDIKQLTVWQGGTGR